MENLEPTKKSKADIARENGAKSRGPVTEQGKARSSRNALKTGEYASTLAHFAHPQAAVLINEDRKAFSDLVDQLIAWYAPGNNPIALSIVRDIAIARWEFIRIRTSLCANWKFGILDHAAQPHPYEPELTEYHAMRVIAQTLYNNGPSAGLARQLSRLQTDIARLERRLVFVRKHFNTPQVPLVIEPREQTNEAVEASVANKPLTGEAADKNTTERTNEHPPIFINENTPSVIRAYQARFPGRKIVVLPPDDVANGLDIDDDMPIAPRRAA